ncbi:MAG: 2'-5' RNA ligase family protein [Candidatus Magasanikbacteria bacterium]|nr:2'-5' RNA ligase family protein [Candidatus Magasanikbacteria bacterium]
MEKLQSSIDIHFKNLEPLISKWYTKLETATHGVPPHITLLWPWISPPIGYSEIEILKNAVKNSKAFSITFDKIEYFQNGTIFLSCKDAKMIQNIMKKIFTAFPECKPYNGEFQNPTPHLTIAKVPDQTVFSEIYNEICTVLKPNLPLTCSIDEITIMKELKTKNWEIVETVQLQK